MDLATISLICGFASPVLSVLAAIFMAGRKAQKTQDTLDKVGELETQVAELSKKLNSQGSVSGLNASLKTNEGEVAALKLKLAAFEAVAGQQMKQWENLEHGVTEMLRETSGTNARIEGMRESITRNQNQIDSLRDRVSGIESNKARH